MSALNKFKDILQHGSSDDHTLVTNRKTSSELNDLFDESFIYWDALTSPNPPSPGDPIGNELIDAKQSLLEMKLLSEKITHYNGSDIEYLSLRIRSFMKFKVPLSSILYIPFKSATDKLNLLSETKNGGLLLHDFDSLNICEHRVKENFKCVPLKSIFYPFLSFLGVPLYFPIFKYDESIERLSTQNIASLLELTMQFCISKRKPYPLIRYLSLPNIVSRFEPSYCWQTTGSNSYQLILDVLLNIIKQLSFGSSMLVYLNSDVLHLALRRIFFDIGSNSENEDFLITLLEKKPELIDGCFAAFSNYQHSAGIEIFPKNLLENESFLFALFNGAGFSDSRCYLPAFYNSSKKAISPQKSLPLEYFFQFYPHIILNDLSSILSRVTVCLLILRNVYLLQLMLGGCTSIAQGSTYFDAITYHSKQLKIPISLGLGGEVDMLLEVIQSGIDLSFISDISKDLVGTIIKLLSVFQINPKIGNMLVSSLAPALGEWRFVVDSLVDGIMSTSKMPRPSFWFIPVGIWLYLLFVVIWLALARFFQNHKNVHVIQKKPTIIAELEENSFEENYFVLVNEEEEAMLRTALKQRPYYKIVE